MRLRCLLLSATPSIEGGSAMGARLHGALCADVSHYPLAGDPASTPQWDIGFLRVARCTRALLRESLGELKRFTGKPIVVIADGACRRWAADVAASSASDFMFEPFTDDELAARVRRVLPKAPAVSPTPAPAGTNRLHNLIGASATFLAQCDRLQSYAACNATVLILGETGTGKEVFAQALHYTSARAPNPWIAVNCGAIPHDLIEDELFGHVRGAYTTAHASRIGLVKEAEGGSLFLDDVDCLPLSAQTKLLRFLQEREFRAVGSNRLERADVRIIAASNRDLAQCVTQGAFRQDLYFRLNVLPLHLPALRERREDIPALARHFVRQFAREFGREVRGLTLGALAKMAAYPWPGNVRELQHVIERAVLLARAPYLDAPDIDCGGTAEARIETSFRSLKARVIEDFERGYIAQLLSSHSGNVSQAARAAGKNRRAFFELMRKYRIASAAHRESQD